MVIKITTGLLLIWGLCNPQPEFRVLTAEKCKWGQGRKEMGMAYQYQIQLVSDKRIKDITFRYLYANNHFIPLSKPLHFEKLCKRDTVQVSAIFFNNRPYRSDSTFVNQLDNIDTAVLFQHKNDTHYIELDKIRQVNCRDKKKRM